MAECAALQNRRVIIDIRHKPTALQVYPYPQATTLIHRFTRIVPAQLLKYIAIDDSCAQVILWSILYAMHLIRKHAGPFPKEKTGVDHGPYCRSYSRCAKLRPILSQICR